MVIIHSTMVLYGVLACTSSAEPSDITALSHQIDMPRQSTINYCIYYSFRDIAFWLEGTFEVGLYSELEDYS